MPVQSHPYVHEIPLTDGHGIQLKLRPRSPRLQTYKDPKLPTALPSPYSLFRAVFCLSPFHRSLVLSSHFEAATMLTTTPRPTTSENNASSTRACQNCSRAKAKCLPSSSLGRVGVAKCARCERLGKECATVPRAVRRRRVGVGS